MIIDTHAHYNDEQFIGDLNETLTDVFNNGVSKIITCSTNYDDCLSALKLTEEYDNIYAAVGVYPHETHKYEWDKQRLEKLASHTKVVAIGEIGLDYYYDDSPKSTQLQWAKNQIMLSKELCLPISFHNRDAHMDTFEMIKKYRPSGVIHCFSGSVEMAREIVKLGMYIGVGGVVTFKNARVSVDVVKDTPIERILLETDAPYMSPMPNRGKRNRSDYIKFIAEKIAEIKGMTYDEVVNITEQNAIDLFKF